MENKNAKYTEKQKVKNGLFRNPLWHLIKTYSDHDTKK